MDQRMDGQMDGGRDDFLGVFSFSQLNGKNKHLITNLYHV